MKTAIALLGMVLAGCSGDSGRDAGRDAAPDSAVDSDRPDVDRVDAADGADDVDPADVANDADEDRADRDPDLADVESDTDLEADAELDAEVSWIGTCADPAPPGAELPDPLPIYSGGPACPTLVAGRNTMASTRYDREFILVVPAGLDPTERLPLIFMWHWLGGEASDFLERGEVQQAADEMRFLAAIPEARGDQTFRWPFLEPPLNSDARVEEEAVFFDDMLACIAEQYNVNESCVSSIGVSAGALWTPQLAQRRSHRIASFLSLSGGTGPAGFGFIPVRSWEGAEHRMPALVLWGGPTDFCIVDFATTSRNLERALTEDGHYFVECVHNCNHSAPPFDPPEGVSAFAGMWEFALSHPFWLPAGLSPFESAGLPATLPEWCGQGMGSATIRSGDCEGGLLGSCT